MTIFSAPLVNARCFALEHLVSIHSTTLDLRWAMLELVWRSFAAMCAGAKARLALPACRIRHEKGRIGQGLDAADTMVAAAGR